jgi:hypothetical protein
VEATVWAHGDQRASAVILLQQRELVKQLHLAALDEHWLRNGTRVAFDIE